MLKTILACLEILSFLEGKNTLAVPDWVIWTTFRLGSEEQCSYLIQMDL